MIYFYHHPDDDEPWVLTMRDDDLDDNDPFDENGDYIGLNEKRSRNQRIRMEQERRAKEVQVAENELITFDSPQFREALMRLDIAKMKLVQARRIHRTGSMLVGVVAPIGVVLSGGLRYTPFIDAWFVPMVFVLLSLIGAVVCFTYSMTTIASEKDGRMGRANAYRADVARAQNDVADLERKRELQAHRVISEYDPTAERKKLA